MKRSWRYWLVRSLLVSALGGIGIVLLSTGMFHLGLGVSPAGFSLLIAVVLLSLISGFVGSVVLSLVAVLSLDYFFVAPLFSLTFGSLDDLVAAIAFLTTSIIITGLMARLRKIAEEELQQTRADLARFARVATVGELTASIAHEVNQPLAGVVSSGHACLRWLASEPPNVDKAILSANRMIRDANRTSEVIQRVRKLVKNTPPQMSPLNVNEAIEEIVILCRNEIEQNRISLKTQLPPDLPLVYADRVQLQQVFINLIVNAIDALKAVSAGPREVSVTTEKDKASGVLASVRDSGVGLDAEKLQHIFEAFHTTKSEGMGMGLTISRSIIEAHGGRLWATPNKPRGATFQLTLPAVQGDAS
jgi:C4-dicarboxylate-specific signal transduction histidine kinase